MSESEKTATTHRTLLIIAATAYLLWWFAVNLILPVEYNPLLSRLLVVLFIFAIWAASFINTWVKAHVKILYICSIWAITGHYYYLFYMNQGNPNWIVGSYITVTAITLTLLSTRTLLVYSIFVMVLSIGLFALLPTLQHSVFLPGIITILFQANVGVRARYATERERQRAHALAENVRIRDEFISIASHELKTPLTVLKLQSQTVERDLKNDKLRLYTPEKVSESVEILNNQITRLTKLVNSLLNVSQISANRLVLELDEMDLVATVREAVAALQLQAKSDNRAITITIDAPTSLLITGDPARIDQVIINLLANATKYGRDKPITVTVRTENKDALVVVTDSGIGIAADFIEKIFERFERARATPNLSGLGLGLYISRKIVEAHGGRISVNSQLDRGSTFTVRLPIQRLP